ncbi:MAG: radical SAM protein, partial [Bacteroides sp.]|nr:radical SAM protein [Bacteroides sp.]
MNLFDGIGGFALAATLPEDMEYLTPDYSIYPQIDRRTAYGFLTRGCPNKCKWCVVPRKEGDIHPYQDVEEIAVEGRDHLILMDNNVLASDYGLQQIEKIIRLGLHVDFNQALDARLVTPAVAKMLARVKWIKRIRFGCDTPAQIDDCERAIELIDGA